jgi:hypothetical protein
VATKDEYPKPNEGRKFFAHYANKRHQPEKFWRLKTKTKDNMTSKTDKKILVDSPISIYPDATRKADGWAPTLEYKNGGKVIGQQRYATFQDALREALEMISCIADYPKLFKNNHPAPNQLIDFSNVKSSDGL